MISHRFLLLLLLISSLTLTAQEYPKQIQLHPDIGDTLDLFERDFFDLYPKVEEFQFATFEMQSETILGSTIYFLESGELKHQVVSQPNCELKRMRYLIDQNREKYNSPYEVKIVRTSGEKIEAELMMYDTTGIYFYSEIIPEITEEMNYYKLPFSKIDSVVVLDAGGLSPVVWGILIGAGVGAIVGLVDGNDVNEPGKWNLFSLNAGEKAGIGALIFGVAGFVLGLIVEIIDSVAEETNEDEGKYYLKETDYLSFLREIAMYNFRNDRELKNKYKLLD